MKFKSILDSVLNGTLFWYVYVSETAECNKEIPFFYISIGLCHMIPRHFFWCFVFYKPVGLIYCFILRTFSVVESCSDV